MTKKAWEAILNVGGKGENDYYVPLVLLNSTEKYTIPVAMALLAQPNFDINYGALMLGACLAVLPIMILFLIFQRNFIDGMMVGAVKG